MLKFVTPVLCLYIVWFIVRAISCLPSIVFLSILLFLWLQQRWCIPKIWKATIIRIFHRWRMCMCVCWIFIVAYFGMYEHRYCQSISIFQCVVRFFYSMNNTWSNNHCSHEMMTVSPIHHPVAQQYSGGAISVSVRQSMILRYICKWDCMCIVWWYVLARWICHYCRISNIE